MTKQTRRKAKEKKMKKQNKLVWILTKKEALGYASCSSYGLGIRKKPHSRKARTMTLKRMRELARQVKQEVWEWEKMDKQYDESMERAL